MSVSYFVFYQGTTEQPAEFVKYYKTEHASFLLDFPGIEDLIIHEEVEWADGQNIVGGSFLLVVEMVFSDIPSLERAISSPARQRAREDFDNFPAWDGKIWHQAMSNFKPTPRRN